MQVLAHGGPGRFLRGQRSATHPRPAANRAHAARARTTGRARPRSPRPAISECRSHMYTQPAVELGSYSRTRAQLGRVHNSPGLWGHVSRACPQWGGWGSAHVRDALAPPHSWRPRAQAQTASTRTPTRTPTAAAARGRAAPRPRTVRMPRCPVRPTRKRAFCIKLHAGSEMACALVFYCVKVASSAPAHHCCKPAGMCNLKFGMGGTSPWLRMC